eukprot:7760487-Ditylum_brightwellii.AAC.1
MVKEGFGTSSSTIKEFTKMYIHYKEYKPKMPEIQNEAHRSHYKREGKCKTKQKSDEKGYCNWGQAHQQCYMDGSQHQYCKYYGSCRHTTDECNITIACCKDCTYHEYKERSHKSKKVCFCNNRAKLSEILSGKSKGLNTIINKKIAEAFSYQEKKEKADLNKFEDLSFLSGSNAGDRNSESKVSHTSNKGSDSE